MLRTHYAAKICPSTRHSRRRCASPRIAALTSSSTLSRRAPRARTRHLTRLRFSEPQGASTLRLLRCSRVSAAIMCNGIDIWKI
jgi:hypothetical protein